MKKLLVFCIGLCLVFVACEEQYVQFESPQPLGVKASEMFEESIHGIYKACDDSINQQLFISNQLIYTFNEEHVTVHRKDLELDSGVVIDVYNDQALTKYIDSLFSEEKLEAEGVTLNFELEGDTIVVDYIDRDTVFQLSEKQVLKKYKKSFFLNTQKAVDNWKVKRLSIEGDSLFFWKLTPSDTLLQYDFVTKHAIEDTASNKTHYYKAKPDKNDFRKLLKEKAFTRSSCYCRQKDE